MCGKDNRGFSLVEIIIVVAVMAVMTGVIGYGLAFVSGKPAEECAQKLASSIQHVRTDTIGKNAACIVISSTEKGIEVSEQVTRMVTAEDGSIVPASEQDSRIVGNKAVKIEYCTTDGSYAELTTPLTLEFDRGSGALKPLKQADGTYGTSYCTAIRITKASTERYVVITPLTGRVAVSDTDTP